MKLINHEKKGSDYLLTFRVGSFWRRLFGMEEKTILFIGSGTVWRYFPSFKRAHGYEGFLADEYARIKHDEAVKRKP